VREVMVPRTSLVVLSTGKSIQENVAAAIEHQFTRYPLCEGNLDNIVGMIHLKDLFRLKGVEGRGTTLLEIKREMPFVPETTSLERMLNLFLSRRVLMAVAVDEYGGTAGLVTLEDLIEEIVGEIQDEYDANEEEIYQQITENEYLFDAGIDLDDLNRLLETDLPTDESDTLGGYIFSKLGKVPVEGEKIEDGHLQMEVLSVDDLRIRKIRLVRVLPAPPAEPEDIREEPSAEAD